MRKTHHKVVLDVYCVSDDLVDIARRLLEMTFTVDPDSLDETVDVQDIQVESVGCTDSR